MHKEGFFSRLATLFRGMFGAEVRKAEVRNASIVYQQALEAQSRHHQELKQATSRLVVLRNRMIAERQQLGADLVLVTRALEKSAETDDDDRSLALIEQQRHFNERINQLRKEEGHIEEQIAKAKQHLDDVTTAIRKLKRERTEMLARKAHAEARLKTLEALEAAGSRSTAQAGALATVRDAIEELETSAGLSQKLDTNENPLSIEALRESSRREEDKEELQRIKQQHTQRLLTKKLPTPTVIVPNHLSAVSNEVIR